MNIDYKKPAGNIFSDDSDHWLQFRKKRFAVAGDGEYAVLKGLDLSGIELRNFVVPWLVFAKCKLDDISFRDTAFTFCTAFVDCSMRGTDFTNSVGGDDLFYRCNLSGAVFDTSRQWAATSLDGKRIPSYFIDCVMSEELRSFLEQDGSVVIEGHIPIKAQQQLTEIAKAPSVDVN